MPRRKYLPRLRGPVMQPASTDPRSARGSPGPVTPRPSAPPRGAAPASPRGPRSEYPPHAPPPASRGAFLSPSRRKAERRDPPPPPPPPPRFALPAAMPFAKPGSRAVLSRRDSPAPEPPRSAKHLKPAPDTWARPGRFALYRPSRPAASEATMFAGELLQKSRRRSRSGRDPTSPPAPSPFPRCVSVPPPRS